MIFSWFSFNNSSFPPLHLSVCLVMCSCMQVQVQVHVRITYVCTLHIGLWVVFYPSWVDFLCYLNLFLWVPFFLFLVSSMLYFGREWNEILFYFFKALFSGVTANKDCSTLTYLYIIASKWLWLWYVNAVLFLLSHFIY